MNKRLRLMAFALTALAATALTGTAHAGGILELRAGAGINSTDPDALEREVNAINSSSVKAEDFDNFHADVFFNLPVLPIGVGVRHEWLSQSDSSNGSNLDVDVNNLSLLVDWRIIDTLVYAGPIVSIGYPWGDVDFSSSGGNIAEQIDGDRMSYSGGLEAGVILGRFLVGAEAGYQSIKLKQKNTGNGSSADIDLSGAYGKAMVGVTFF